VIHLVKFECGCIGTKPGPDVEDRIVTYVVYECDACSGYVGERNVDFFAKEAKGMGNYESVGAVERNTRLLLLRNLAEDGWHFRLIRKLLGERIR
jgi:hypothetical protein